MSDPPDVEAEGDAGVPDPDAVPMIRVTSGDPSAEELAALVAVFAARFAAAPDPQPPLAPRSEWGAHGRRLRGIHNHGPGAWRASAWRH